MGLATSSRTVSTFEGATAVTPADPVAGAALDFRALYIGGAGAVRVTTVNNEVVTFAAVPVGTILPIRVLFVHSTGTTATNILGLV